MIQSWEKCLLGLELINNKNKKENKKIMNITKIMLCVASVASVGFASDGLISQFDRESENIGTAGLDLIKTETKKRGRPTEGSTSVVLDSKRKRIPSRRFEQEDRIGGRPDSSKRSRKIKIKRAAEAEVPVEAVNFDASRAVLDSSRSAFGNVRSADYISSDDESQHSLLASMTSSSPNTPSGLPSSLNFDSSPFANLLFAGLGVGSPNSGSSDDFFGVSNTPVAVHESFLSGSSSGVLPRSEVENTTVTSFAWTQSPAGISTGTSSSRTPMSQALGENLVWGNSPLTPFVGNSSTPASVKRAVSTPASVGSTISNPFSPEALRLLHWCLAN